MKCFHAKEKSNTEKVIYFSILFCSRFTAFENSRNKRKRRLIIHLSLNRTKNAAILLAKCQLGTALTHLFMSLLELK